MKGIGNYRVQATPPSFERRLAQLAMFHGPRASIRLLDGTTHTMSSEPLRKLGLVEGNTFMLVSEYRGRQLVKVTVERQTAARGAAPGRPVPKVMIREGLKVTTRR